MLFFKLKNFNEARIWNLPPKELLINNKSNVCTYEFLPSKNYSLEIQSLFLELMLARGGRIIYGALGCDYKYENNEKISLEISTKKTSSLFENSLLKNVENIYLGLPNEYLDSVFHGVDRAFHDGKLNFSGKLSFCYAAYGDVSSCEWIFYILSYMLILLLNLNTNNVTAEDVEKILQEAKSKY